MCSTSSRLSPCNESAFYKSWAWSKWNRVTVRKINGLYHPTVDYKLLIVWISVWRLERDQSLLPQSLISTDIVHYFSNANPRYIWAGQIPEENNNFSCRYLRAVIISVPINSSISVYQVATENRNQHWVLLSQGGWQSLWRLRLCSGAAITRSQETEISFWVGTAWHQATQLSLRALNWEAGHQPDHLPEEQQAQCVWTLLEKH